MYIQVFMTLFKVLAGMYVLSTGNLLLCGLAFYFYYRHSAPQAQAAPAPAVQQVQGSGQARTVEGAAPVRT